MSLNNVSNGGIISSKERSFSSRVDADKLFRPWTESVWPTLTNKEREAAYRYTSESAIFNRPLRGYDKDWNIYLGVGKVPLDNENGELYIRKLQSALEKSELKEDVWLFRGSDQQSLAGLLGIGKEKIIPSNVHALNRKFAGNMIMDPAFFSTGIASDAGFHNKISYEILAPKGTKGLYAEPFSHFGGTNTTGDWDGRQKADSIKSEAEVVLQAGTRFTIQEVKLVNDKVTVALKVIVR